MKKTRKFTGELECLGVVCDFVTDCAKKCELSETQVYAVQLAVDEAVTNIIEHAYQGEDKGTIECDYRVDEDGLTIIISDHGNPFDPTKIKMPNLKASLKDREAHGLGLYFMRQWMDEVHFEFIKGRNTLIMVKHRGKRD